MKELNEIRSFLREKSSEKAKESWQRFIPTAKKIYGIYVNEINKLVSKYKKSGFELIRELWHDEYLEERILAAKLLGKICKRDPELTLKLVREFINDLNNWAECDTLATQGIRPIVKTKQDEILKLSQELIKSNNPWKNRFGIVLLINFKNNTTLRPKIKSIIKQLEKTRKT